MSTVYQSPYDADDGHAPEYVSVEYVSISRHHRKWLFVLLLLAVIFTAVVGGGGLYAHHQLHLAAPPPTGPISPSEAGYWRIVYPGSNMPVDIGSSTLPFMFLWDTACASLFSQPAANLTLQWPPDLDTQYRLVAYPFPSQKYKNVVLNTIYGIFQLVNTYRDDHGFPGFLINRYNPNGWAIGNPFMTPAQASQQPEAPEWQAAASAMSCRSGSGAAFAIYPFQWVEVIHACYPVPGYGYPFCDDQGYWLYLARGTGVWWNTGNACVGLHKLERGTHLTALMLLWSCQALFNLAPNPRQTSWTEVFAAPDSLTWAWKTPPNASLSDWKAWLGVASDLWRAVYSGDTSIDSVPEFGEILENIKAGKPPASKLTFRTLWDLAVAKNVALAIKLKGGPNAFQDVWKAIKQENTGTAISPNMSMFFRSFKNTNRSKRSYYTLTVGVSILLASLAAALTTLLLSFLGVGSPWLSLVCFSVAAAVGAWLWFRGIEDVIEGLGWNTLDGAMVKHGLTADEASLTDVWNAYCSPFWIYPAGAPPSDPQVSTLTYKGGMFRPDSELMQVFGGFGNTWIFDDAVVLFGAFLQYDSIIFHSQPNKSGTWTVEMLDLTHVRLTSTGGCDAEAGSSICIYRGGVCGSVTCQDYSAQGCKGDPSFFACVNTLFPFPPGQPPPLEYQRGGLCRAFQTCSDPFLSRLGNEDPQNTRFAHILTLCSCREREDTRCLSCKGHTSGDLCAPTV